MEKKVSKRTPTKKKAPSTNEVFGEPDDPFTERVIEAKPATPVRAINEKPAVKAVQKILKKAAELTGADPFAEKAGDAAKKKSVARTRNAKPETATSPVAVPGSTVGAKPKRINTKKKSFSKTNLDAPVAEPAVERSLVFKALAQVSLPELKKENRARLLMQSPTKLYFYWSLGKSPWQQLRGAFGSKSGSYALVLKLTNSRTGREDIYAAEAEGETWFDVNADGEYRAEIGFYAPNRPYFRIVHSNVVETPRRTPSPNPAGDSRWTVSATKFAEVLDVAGFTRDAVHVAVTGDNVSAAAGAARLAFVHLTGSKEDIDNFAPDDIRGAMLSIAGGATLEDLRQEVSAPLFALLQANADKLTTAAARSALGKYFDIAEDEWIEHETVSAVFGASLVHFPKRLTSPNRTSRYNPVSSRGR